MPVWFCWKALPETRFNQATPQFYKVMMIDLLNHGNRHLYIC